VSVREREREIEREGGVCGRGNGTVVQFTTRMKGRTEGRTEGRMRKEWNMSGRKEGKHGKRKKEGRQEERK
jgi:hypothetical protein